MTAAPPSPARIASRVAAAATNKERRRQRAAGELITVVAPVSLQFATAKKRAALGALLREVRACINRYIKVCWKQPDVAFDAATLKLVPVGSLSYRHRSNALQVALNTISSTRKSARAIGKRPSMPRYGVKSAVPMSKLLCTVEKGTGSFDYILKVAGLVKGKPILVPVKSHKHLNSWLEKGTLLDSLTLSEDVAALQINVSLGPLRTPNEKVLGVDLGYLKLLATSDGDFHGQNMRAVVQRVQRSKPGSKGRLRARRARTHYINRQVNELPWESVSAIGVEELAGIKQGKKPGRSKQFRKKMAPWVHRQATARIEFKALVNRVRLVAVNPRNTSRECPLCGKVARENRRGEVFRCVRCNYTADADFVGSLNIAARARSTLGAVYGGSASTTERG